jgi:DNA replication initiation complex subunit (GINS family)
MEIDYLVIALDKTLSFLRESDSSLYADLTVEEVIRELEEQLDKRRKSQPVDIERIRFLFAPTGSIQEISINNDWGQEFLEVAAWL